MADANSIGRAFQITLDSEGYSFQQRVLQECLTIGSADMRQTQHHLRIEAPELPVQTQGKDTRVDLILRVNGTYPSQIPIFLVCETKRSNPAFADWCFARMSPVGLGRTGRAVVERLIFDRNLKRIVSAAAVGIPASDDQPYHIGLPVKPANSRVKGDDGPKGRARDIIDDAVAQVMRGLNGFAEFLDTYPHLVDGTEVLLIPVIFTTAALFTSDVDLTTASLATGILPVDSVHVGSAEWLWYQSHVSAGLRHSISRGQAVDEIGSIARVLAVEYSRSVAIVGTNGIKSFLTTIGGLAELADVVR